MPGVIAIVVGALLGAFMASERGALVGAALGWLIVRSFTQQNEIALLRRMIAADVAINVPAQPLAQATPPVTKPDVFAPPVQTPARRSEPSAPHTEYFDANDFSLDPAAGIAPQAPRTPAPPPEPTPDWTEPLRAWFFGGNTIVKAGIGILFIGLAFLAKYATENVHLPVEFRLAAIGIAAIVLLVIGWRLRLRRPGYAQALQGGSVALLYLTLFAAFRYYQVIGVGPAFVLMVAVAGLAAALAVLQDARALAVIGALGGFATPVLVSTGSGNYVALFAYYFILDAGIAAVAWSKTWRSLNLVGFIATFVVATAWGVLKYQPQEFAKSEGFLIAFFLLFVLIMLLPARRALAGADERSASRIDGWVNSSLLLGLPTITFALQYGLVRDTPFGAALSALALAGFYVALASWMKKRPALGITFDASIAIAVVFLTLVIPFALDERSTAGAWTLEGAGLVWIGFRQQRVLPRLFGYFLLFIAGISMLLGHVNHGAPLQMLNAYLFNGLMAAVASIAAAYFIERFRNAGDLRGGEEIVEPILIALATLWLMSAAAVEIWNFVPDRLALAASVASASAVAALFAALAQRLVWRNITWPTLIHTPLLFLAALADAPLRVNPAADGGWWAWPVAFAAHALVLRFATPRWPGQLQHAVHVGGVIVLALLGALLGRSLTQNWGDAASAWPWLGWLIAPALLLLLLPHPASATVWPISARPDAYRRTACAIIAAALLLWTLVANIASDGSAAPLVHVPLLNPLDIGIGVALIAIVLWLRSAGIVVLWPLALVAAAVFVWLNAMLVRAFHHYAGVPYRVDAWINSLAVQTGITLLWTVTALITMWLAARWRARWPWMVGAALLAAVVVKLLLVDLSGTGTVTRIVSFIGVGILMLVIGYVAPLPGKEQPDAIA